MKVIATAARSAGAEAFPGCGLADRRKERRNLTAEQHLHPCFVKDEGFVTHLRRGGKRPFPHRCACARAFAGLALDRVGFTVEDRDRSKGFYFVRYVDPQDDAVDTAKKDTGLLSRLLFWKSSKPDAKAEQYRVLVRDNRDASAVQVLNKDGAQDNSENARKILTLLHQQLK